MQRRAAIAIRRVGTSARVEEDPQAFQPPMSGGSAHLAPAVGRFQAAQVQPQSVVMQPADDGAGQAAQDEEQAEEISRSPN